MGFSVAAATSAGFATGLLLNYAFHARVTFGRLHSAGAFLRFLCVVALNYLLTIAFVSAALVLARHGLQPLILEKQDKLGGSTCMSGGVLWIPNHPLQAAAGVQDSFEDGLAYMNAAIGEAGPASSPERKRKFLLEGPACVQFLLDSGMQWVRSTGYSDYYDELPGGKPEGRSLTAPLASRVCNREMASFGFDVE